MTAIRTKTHSIWDPHAENSGSHGEITFQASKDKLTDRSMDTAE